MQQIAGQGHIHTHKISLQPCLQDRMKQITSQRHIYKQQYNPAHEADRQSGTHLQTTIQPCLQDRMKQIASQRHIQTTIQPCLQDCI